MPMDDNDVDNDDHIQSYEELRAEHEQLLRVWPSLALEWGRHHDMHPPISEETSTKLGFVSGGPKRRGKAYHTDNALITCVERK